MTPSNTFFNRLVRFASGLPFFREVYRIGGIDAFPLAQKDILETMNDDLEKKADELSVKKLAGLLSIIDTQSIVKYDKRIGGIFIGDKRADEGRLRNLKAEAEFFLQSDLWKLISETPKELAQQTMFVSGENLVDLQKGRSMLYTLSVQKNIVETFHLYEPKT